MCQQCETKPVYEFTNKRKLCRNCYVYWFEKKFLYTIRRFNMISKKDILGYENKKDFRNVTLIYLLKMLERKSPIRVNARNFNKKAVANTTDIVSGKIIHNFIKKNFNIKIKPIENKIIYPLYLFLDTEVLLYAKIKKLKFVSIKKTKSKWFDFVESLEKKHPEIKRAIVNSYLELFC